LALSVYANATKLRETLLELGMLLEKSNSRVNLGKFQNHFVSTPV
jgi:hypothetical protein